MKDNDYLKEQIKFSTEILKLMVILLIASLSGVLSLVTKENQTPIELFLIYIGSILAFIFLWRANNLFDSIVTMIEELNIKKKNSL